jgi:septum site-determining protein MinD
MSQAKTIVVFSTKGGVGKTLLATNLAVGLAKESNKKILLVDLDLQVVGDMARILDILPKKSFIDIIPLLDQVSPREEIKTDSFISRHSSKIDFLPAVLRAAQSSHIKPEVIKKVLPVLSKDYDYIVVDAGRSFTESLVTVLNFANLIILVVTPDILSVYQTKWTLDILQYFHFPLKMIKIILNRAESMGGISWQEIRATLPCEIVCQIPSEGKIVGFAVNRKIPVIIDSPRSKVSQAIKKLSSQLLTRKDIFIGHQEIAISPEKVEELAKEGEFWQAYKLSEPLVEMKPSLGWDEITDLKKHIHQKLIEALDLKHMDLDLSDEEKVKSLYEKTEKLIADYLAEETHALLSSFEVRQRLIKEIADEALGLGPLEDLIKDPGVTDIMVNNKDQVYVERHGKIELTTKRFISDEQVRQVIERIIAPLGRRIDESTPMVDARLSDGSRVNAIIPPLSLSGPMLTIRKFAREIFSVDDILKLKTLTPAMAEFLKAAVLARRNIIISGGTGSGKTTVLNILSSFINEDERIITIEDAAELKLNQIHWARLEARPPNIEGKGAITIRELFRNTLRMRPDRIIIGECRSVETLDMLQAMNTGHDGSMTTIHANSTHDVLARLDSMILMAGTELPLRAIREMIASAIDLIVHTARLSDGSRKIVQVTEIAEMLDEIHINLKDIFIYKQKGMDAAGNVIGEFQTTGYIPSCFEDIKTRGVPLSEDVFKAS